MTTRTRDDLTRRLSEKLHLEESAVSAIVDSFLYELCRQIAHDRTIEIKPLGAFAVVDRPARMVCNPATGEPILVRASRTVGFRAGERLVRRLEVPEEVRSLLHEEVEKREEEPTPAPVPVEEPVAAPAPAPPAPEPEPQPVTPQPVTPQPVTPQPVTMEAPPRVPAEPAGEPDQRSPIAVDRVRDARLSQALFGSAPEEPVATRPADKNGEEEEPGADVRFGTRVLCVASGKGGTGKSFTVCNLAVRLATMGQRVIVLDADLGLANLHLLLGINPRYNLSHVLGGEVSLVDILEEGPCGVRLISGGSGVLRLANLREREIGHFVQGLADLEEHADVVIIDTAAGISPRTVAFLAASREILLVTTPDITAMTDAYAILKSIAHSGRENQSLSLVVNQASTPIEAEAVYRRLSGVSRKFLGRDLDSLGYIYEDEAVSKAVALRTPLVLADPGSRAAQGVTKLAQRVRDSKLPHQDPRRYADRLRGILINQAM